jgi:hypothetical protein
MRRRRRDAEDAGCQAITADAVRRRGVGARVDWPAALLAGRHGPSRHESGTEQRWVTDPL